MITCLSAPLRGVVEPGGPAPKVLSLSTIYGTRPRYAI
jgi:hypothetical protein